MNQEMTISFEGDHVKVIADGEKNYEFSSKLWAKISNTCNENDCYRVLGIAKTTSPLNTDEGYDHAQLFEQLGITGDYRIAWVELNPKAFDAVYFVETVLVNRGYMARLFSDVDEAKEWLFVDS